MYMQYTLRQLLFYLFVPIMSMSLFQAIEDYSMIRDGDRLLVCLSGGKDSLSLLHTMRQYQFYSRSQVGIVYIHYF